MRNRLMKPDDEMMEPEAEIIEFKEYDADAIDKEIKETLTSLLAGIFGLSLLFFAVGVFIARDKIAWSLGLSFGFIGAVVMAVHLTMTLKNQMDMDAKSGNKYMIKNTMLRFIFMAVLIYISLKVSRISFIGVLLGILTLKMSALLQPYINKKLSKKGRWENGK